MATHFRNCQVRLYNQINYTLDCIYDEGTGGEATEVIYIYMTDLPMIQLTVPNLSVLEVFEMPVALLVQVEFLHRL